MADQSTTGAPEGMSLDKGKGKAVEDTPMGQDMSMDEEESSDESGPEDLVCVSSPLLFPHSLPRIGCYWGRVSWYLWIYGLLTCRAHL
jgi:hypothetical protein